MKRRVLITGGGKRIGAALVRAFARETWEVYVHVNRSFAEAAALVEDLPDPGLHHITQCDFSDPAQRKEWLKTLPAFDLIICNGSCYRLTRRGEQETAENRQRYWQVNYYSTLEILAYQKEHLPENLPAAAIIMLDCDVLDPDGGVKEFIEPPEGADSYLASRILLAQKLSQLAKDYAPEIRINAIAPGPVLPPADCVTGGMTVILEKVPMNKPVSVQNIVDTALFLANNNSTAGAIIPVDGGMHLSNQEGF